MRTFRFAHTSLGATASSRSIATPRTIERDWVWGDATGRGVRVCVIDSGVDAEHPLVGGDVMSYVAEEVDDAWVVRPDDVGDVAGHGTACAGVIRSLAPECELISVRVLAGNLRGNGDALITALEWAVGQRFPLINVSLSSRKEGLKERLHDLADTAFFAGVSLVSSAHNSPVVSYPWRFPSVISVGSHSRTDPEYFELNPDPPVDFFACGINVSVAWPGGSAKVVSGNSFATPHITGLCARILQRHPEFRTPQLRHVLAAVADNLVRSPQ
ncbi:S8 family serine peptidase [Catellatospora tritici]|uniref:S8 family serine peptidase n=1 Tax=Catellatospora tritici TaxID=2851566 RepID=UPI001C2DC8F1|nr:S8 family serine peptidase [Catellatospora tritici]MBV1850645.1 S8 family serine peptidase [Catellatospora tritici]